MNILLVLPPQPAHVWCSTALIRCLKKQLASAVVHVLLPEHLDYLLAVNPYIDMLLPAHRFHTDVAPGKYDLMIDLAKLEENKLWADNNGAAYLPKQGSFFSRVKKRLSGGSKEPLALQFFEMAAPTGVRYDGAGLDGFVPVEAQLKASDIPTAHSAGYLVFAIGDGLRLHSNVIAHFCASVPYPLIFTGPAAAAELVDHFAKTDPVKVYNSCGKFSDAENLDLFRQARLMMTDDPALLQGAAAFGKPSIFLQTEKPDAALVPPFYASQQSGQPQLFSAIEIPPVAIAANGREIDMPDTIDLANKMVQLVQAKWAI